MAHNITPMHGQFMRYCGIFTTGNNRSYLCQIMSYIMPDHNLCHKPQYVTFIVFVLFYKEDLYGLFTYMTINV